jgi:hypothetical protein
MNHEQISHFIKSKTSFAVIDETYNSKTYLTQVTFDSIDIIVLADTHYKLKTESEPHNKWRVNNESVFLYEEEELIREFSPKNVKLIDMKEFIAEHFELFL